MADLFDFNFADTTAEALVKDANFAKGGRDLNRMGVVNRSMRSEVRKATYMAKANGGHAVATRAALTALLKADLSDTVTALTALTGLVALKVTVLDDGDSKPRTYRWDSASSATASDSVLATDEGGAGRWIAVTDDLDAGPANTYGIAVLKYMGNRTIVQIDGLAPAAGDAYVATSAGTPAAGASDALVIGDLAEYDGTQWKKILAASSGKVPNGTFVVVGTGTLVAPLTDVTDRSKLAKFDGSSNTPTLYVPGDGWQATVLGEGGVYENRAYIYDAAGSVGWKALPSDAIVDGDFTANGLMERTGAGSYTSRGMASATNGGAGNNGKALTLDANGKAAGHALEDATSTSAGGGDAGKLVKLGADGKLGISLHKASCTVLTPSPDVGVTPGDDELKNLPIDTPTAFATTKTIPAGTAVGAHYTLRALVQVIKQNATDNMKGELFVGGTIVADITAYDVTAGDVVDLRADVFVDVAGASGKFHSVGVGSRPNGNPKSTNLVTQSQDFSAATTVSVKWSVATTQSNDDIADLIALEVVEFAG